ncbi:ATP-binding cassette domain-containing protein [Wenxinia marina]|uniref:ABC-type enterochelin transport system, ATPase component n=1 Tax=Wenxinia marina DSM 24838 TaxID=1123501 RepID=A0A0D0Q4E5_9RHOB|nr:ATP-binding cassette domain-containing protein [Wenxinia marina]KIQ69409.1 ABC-type enterochelin transport system, ATPase component [Wenxinia marina DSM 24838]GGL58111.1 ABC transporter ATP-binding protein [Wenxinia marina]
MIDLANVTVRRGSVPALDDVSLSFGRGGITALIGPNGAGKSTLLHAMSGLLPPTSGRVRVEGRDLAAVPATERARTVAVLTQTERVTARLTVRELVSFGRWPHHRGRPKAADRETVEEALELFDLSDLAGRRIDTLSGGQRQRAFVTMAYAQETPWMLLDEPLAALDPRHARDLMDRLHALTRPGAPGQRSVVVVLHDLGAAARYADRIVALRRGRLVTSGARLLTLTGPMLTDLFETSLTVRRLDGRDVVVPG